jgi:hypothetical protein
MASDAMATFELCLRPVVIKKKVLLKQTSVLLITLVLCMNRHSESLNSSVLEECCDW